MKIQGARDADASRAPAVAADVLGVVRRVSASGGVGVVVVVEYLENH